MKKHRDATVLVNFASLRSAYDSTVEAMKYPQIRCIAIIAEGIPENLTRKLLKLADENGVTIIGPATVSFEPNFSLINNLLTLFILSILLSILGRWVATWMF